MKLSIIIPVRNEEFSIKKTIDQLQGKLKILTYEIIFINDYSDDNTFEVIKNLIKMNPQINIYNNQMDYSKDNISKDKAETWKSFNKLTIYTIILIIIVLLFIFYLFS